ncbi:FG-GAP repeat protein [Anatilimnocola aggregata]|uniref:FG-GAP repeat protein n=1 Tax=Anatilimnocola aggregata TaxID=2528021 RepID=A0A517Y9J7_9BACT|nr:CRTAC1 family protein [Anatilimnocola aggregata]QDU26896.1 FG-GAP repeat protein [Anatilimnocola aggregata]
MNRRSPFRLLALAAALSCSLPLSAAKFTAAAEPKTAFMFQDAGDSAGLFPAVAEIAGHGCGWGDVNGDGFPDLYVGTFGGMPYKSKSNQLFINKGGKFVKDEQPALQITGRANGAIFVDFDNDGDLDLYATNHAINSKKPETSHFMQPNTLFRNDENGKFTDVSKESGACVEGMACRSTSALDYDGDGLLDLLVGECFFQGGKSRTKLYRNEGKLKFKDVTKEVGLPDEITGFGVAAGDVNGDTRPDIFVSGRHHGNRLFLGSKAGKFEELPAANADFSWASFKDGDDTTCGVTFGDVNRDGLTDIVVGSHFSKPWFVGGIGVRLYLNRGVTGGLPKFEDVSQQVGLVGLPLKSPHVEIQDFDNDGWPEIYTSIVKFAENRPYPVIFKNNGVKDGLPQFATDALAVNDFPTEEDTKISGSGKFFEKMEAEKKIVYSAPGPTCDYDRDGKIDMFLPNWWTGLRSLLLKNETASGNYLDVTVQGKGKTNLQGIGSTVRIYEAGKLGQKEALLGQREIAVGFGYASGQEAAAHFGLGKATTCDVEVILPNDGGTLKAAGVAANQRLKVAQ